MNHYTLYAVKLIFIKLLKEVNLNAPKCPICGGNTFLLPARSAWSGGIEYFCNKDKKAIRSGKPQPIEWVDENQHN